MPKRQAEKQLTDRNVDDAEDEEEPTTNGDFAKASAATIEKRQIKGLPGRRAGGAAPATPPAAPVVSSNGVNGALSDDNTEALLVKQRGLNLSAQRALGVLSRRVEQDPFIDLTPALEELWTNYGKAKRDFSKNEPVTAPVSQPKAPAFAAWTGPAIPSAATGKEEAAKTAAPVPPSALAFGGSIVSAPSELNAPPSGGVGFTPTASTSSDAPKSAFSFSLPSVPSSAPISADAGPSSPDLSVPVAFNSATVAAAAPRKPSPLRQAETLLSSPVSSGAVTPVKEEPAKPPNPFSGFSFGMTAKPVASAFAFGASSQPTATTAPRIPKSTAAESVKPVTPPKPLTTTFGGGKSGSPPTFGSAKFNSPTASSAFGSANVGFSFGGATDGVPAPAPTSAFGFGSKSATTGFAFGSPGTASAFGAPSSSAPSFSQPPFASTSSQTFSGLAPAATSAASDAGDGTDVEAEASGPPEVKPGDSALLAPGPGEEDEETLYECRGRLYDDSVPKTKDNEGNPVENPGNICVVRLKRNTKTDVKRLLGRSEGNGKVIMNTRLFKGLEFRIHNVRVGDIRPARTLAFPLFSEDGKIQPWRMRVRNEEVAKAFISAVEAQVATLS